MITHPAPASDPDSGTQRMSAKIKEYIANEQAGRSDKQFPHAACIIDVTRCSVAFSGCEDLLQAFCPMPDATSMGRHSSTFT